MKHIKLFESFPANKNNNFFFNKSHQELVDLYGDNVNGKSKQELAQTLTTWLIKIDDLTDAELADADYVQDRIETHKSFLDENWNFDNVLKLDKPIIPDAVAILKKLPNIIRVTSIDEYNKLTSEQKYFSASQSHCFYTVEEYNKWSKSGSKYTNEDSEKSDILKNVGDLVAVWDNKNKEGFVLTNEEHHKNL